MPKSRSWDEQLCPCLPQTLVSSGSDRTGRRKSAVSRAYIQAGWKVPCGRRFPRECAERSRLRLPSCEQKARDSSLEGGTDEGRAHPFLDCRAHDGNLAFKEVVRVFYQNKLLRFCRNRENFLQLRDRSILVVAST